MNYGQWQHRWGFTRDFERFVGGNQVTLLHDGEQCYPAMLHAIESAKEEIFLEMYWFASDTTGERFANALIEKAREGIQVFVIYDAIGSFEADPAQWKKMRAAGCYVFEYNPIALWRRRFRIGVVNNRNHRKMLIVDRNIGFTGGVNIGDPWASAQDGGEGWRDDMIRVEGPAVNQMCRIFLHGLSSIAQGLDGVREVSAARIQEEHDAPDTSVRVLANHFFGERRAIRSEYLRRIEEARARVYITNSYFVPDRRIRLALAEAAQRGVEVRVILPGESDVPAVFYAGRKQYTWMQKRGIHLHEWQGVILHSKTAVIDGAWCTVGTYNLDYRSLRFNLEVTVSVEDQNVAQACERRFLLDLENAPLVDAQAFRFRSLSERFLENFFYLFRKLL